MSGAAPQAWSARSAAGWAEHLGVPRLELHRALPSTNRRLREIARGGAEPFTVVVADAQTEGRGREGKAWHSPAGTGLWISILLPLPRWGSGTVLPLAVGVATARVVEHVTDGPAGLKWPNDVLVRGRKVAGILCESVGEPGGAMPGGVAAGVGLNLREPEGGFPADLRDSAGFLESLAARPIAEPELARNLLAELREWAHPAPSELSGRLRVEWESRDLLRQRRVRIESGEMGVARGVSPEGALRIGFPDGELRSIRSGSVRPAEPEAFPAPSRMNGNPGSPEAP